MSVQLAARGEEDVYITGKPSITYFLARYKKSTPFVTEYVEYSFDGLPVPNRVSTCTIPPRGDILSDVTLKIVFPPLYTIRSDVYCYPTYPDDMVDIQVYVTTGYTSTLAFQAGKFGYYYSTFNINFWATPFTPWPYISVSYNATTNKFEFTMPGSSGYVAIYFPNEQSASFWGFDIANPTYSSNGFAITNDFVTSQLDLTQAGWIQGYTPRKTGEGVNYNSNYATDIIKEARLLVGGQIVSRVTGDYIKLLNDYDVPYENQAGLTALTGENDTSIKYISTTSFVKVPFGLDILPLCALERNDVKVEVDFADSNSLIQSPVLSTGIFDPLAYTYGDMRVIYNQSPYGMGTRATPYGNVLTWRDWSGYLNTYDMLKLPSDPSAYTRQYTSAVTPYNIQPGFNLLQNNYNVSTISSNLFSTTNTVYLTRMPVSDYFLNIDTRTTASVAFWPYPTLSGGEYGSQSIQADARYVYIGITVSTLWLPKTTWPSIGLTGTRVGMNSMTQLGQVWTCNFRFYGPTTISLTSGAGQECIRVMLTNSYLDFCPIAATTQLSSSYDPTAPPFFPNNVINVVSPTGIAIGQYIELPGIYGAFVTSIVGNAITFYRMNLTSFAIVPAGTSVYFRTTPVASLVSQTAGVDMCDATFTLTFSLGSPPNSFDQYSVMNFVCIRYDTTQDINLAASYEFFNDFNAIHPTIPMPFYDGSSGYFRLFSQGSYLFSAMKMRNSKLYLIRINSLEFMRPELTGGYTTVNVTDLLSPGGIGVSVSITGPPAYDDTYLYFNGTNNPPYLARVKLNASITLLSSWEYIQWGNITGNTGGEVGILPRVYDGRYIYYIGTSTSASPPVLLYDTTKDFTALNSFTWISVPISGPVSTWDIIQGGRYIYLQSWVFNVAGNYPLLIRIDPLAAVSTTVTASVLTEYTHLGQQERDYFKNSLQTIPYDNMQSMFVQVTPGTSYITLPFLGPVKELYFYSNTFSNISSTKLTFNGEDLFSFSNKYLSVIQPFETAVTMPSYNSYTYNFGTPVNMSRIGSKVLTVTQGGTVGLWVYAKSVNVLGIRDGVSSLLFNSVHYLV